MLLEPTPARREGTPRKGREIYVTLACLRQGGGGGKLRSFGINSTSQARLESYAWTHAVAPLSCATVRCRLPWLLAASLAATLKPNAGSAHKKGGQVMFCPRPLLELPCKAERWQGACKKRTSNVSPSTITSAPLQGGPAASTWALLLDTNTRSKRQNVLIVCGSADAQYSKYRRCTPRRQYLQPLSP